MKTTLLVVLWIEAILALVMLFGCGINKAKQEIKDAVNGTAPSIPAQQGTAPTPSSNKPTLKPSPSSSGTMNAVQHTWTVIAVLSVIAIVAGAVGMFWFKKLGGLVLGGGVFGLGISQFASQYGWVFTWLGGAVVLGVVVYAGWEIVENRKKIDKAIEEKLGLSDEGSESASSVHG